MADRTRRRRKVEDDDAPVTRRQSRDTVRVDMREAQSGGRSRYPEDDYKVKIIKAEKGVSKKSGNSQIIVTYEFIEPEKFAGKTFKDYFALTPKAAWRVGNLLDAVDLKWSQKVMDIRLSKLQDKVLGITIVDGDPYNGKVSSKVADYLDEETINDMLEGSEDIDEDEDVDEDEDEDEDEDDFDEDDDDL